jgi:hypothetical protein
MISKLHFEVQDLKSYFDRHKAQASKAHTFYQLIWFTVSGTHYVDYEEINYPKKHLLVLNQIHSSAHTNNEGVLIHFNDFSSINLTRISTTIFTFCFNEIGQPYMAQDTAVNRINSLLQFIQEENQHKETSAKEQLFFTKQFYSVLNAQKKKRNGCF